MRSFRCLIVAAISGIALTLSPAPADAGSVALDTGNIGPTSIQLTGPTQISISLTAPDPTPFERITRINNFGGPTDFFFPGIQGSFPPPLVFNLTSLVDNGTSISFDAVGPPLFTKTYTGEDSRVVSLDYNITAGVATHDGLTLGGTITAISSNMKLSATPIGGVLTEYDFAPLVGGHHQFAFTGDAYATIKGGGPADGSGSFTQQSVPEPASMALLGIGLSLLLMFGWSRRLS